MDRKRHKPMFHHYIDAEMALELLARVALFSELEPSELASIVFIFRYRSFKEVIARGQEERATSRSPREPREPE